MKLFMIHVKKTTRFLAVLYCLSLLYACATFQKAKTPENHVALSSENLSAINGTYITDTTAILYHNEILWGKSLIKSPEMYKAFKEKPVYATLKVVDNKTINVIIYNDNRTLKTYDLKGKIKNGYFVQKQKFYIIPAIYVNSWYSGRFRIGLLNNQSVSTQYITKDFGTVYFVSPYNNSKTPKAIEHLRVRMQKN